MRAVHSTRCFRTCHSKRRNLATAFRCALPIYDAVHAIRCVPRTILGYFCIFHSKRRLLAAGFGSALSPSDVDHPVAGGLCTILRRSCASHSKRRSLPADFGSALSALRLHVDYPVLCVLCVILHLFVIATLNDGCLLQPSVVHVLLLTSTVPSGACCAQYSVLLVPTTPEDDR